MPPNPDNSEFNSEEDARIEGLLGWDEIEAMVHCQPSSSVAWLTGDQEWYPVWPTTLYEQEQNWREKFLLFTIDNCVERLAQEAKLYIALNDLAHES